LVSEITGTQMLSENACRVLQTRYLRRGTRGEVIETPE
jgi:ribonucleotide reductase alpha subunit